MYWVPDEDHPPFGHIEVDPILCIGCKKCTSKGPDGAFLDGCPWDAIEMVADRGSGGDVRHEDAGLSVHGSGHPAAGTRRDHYLRLEGPHYGRAGGYGAARASGALSGSGLGELVLEPGARGLHRQYGLGRAGDVATSCAKRRQLKLLNLNRRNIELLVMTKLATVFEIFTDEQDAVNSFYPDRKIKTFDILTFVQQMKKED